MAERIHWRPHTVGCKLSDEEYAALCEIRQALGVTVRDLLLQAIRRARARLTYEQRRQRRNGSN